jgi:tetratricopeptide (TPR) repeat protein
MRFEQMRAVFSTLMTKANVNIPIPLQIVAFRNNKEFKLFAPLWQGKPTQLAGLFQGGQDRSFIMLDMSVENPWTVVFHEYAHQLMNGILTQQLDPWFEEGFAEYFSTIEVDNKQARVGKAPANAYLELQQAGTMKIADLFKVRQNSQTYNENSDRRGVFYAESNLLMHYIYDNQLLPKVIVYFDLTNNKKVPVEDAIQQAFGMSPTQFDKALHDYVGSERSMQYVFPTPADIATSGYTAVPLSPADSAAILADIHLHSLDYKDKAIEEFQEILKSDANNAAACRGLGYAYLQKRESKLAAEYFRRAAQLNSKDPRVHYYSAMLMNGEGVFGDRSRLLEMIKELETSISLDPNFADPYSMLGFAQCMLGDMQEGLANMKKAISLSPHNQWYQFNLAQMYMKNRQPDLAIPMLEVLSRSQDPQIAHNAGEFLARAQQFKEMLEGKAQLQDRGTQLAQEKDEDEDEPDRAPAPAASPEPGRTAGATKYMKGTLTSVDCTTPPSAVLTVVAGNATWKMKVTDINHTVVLGADAFSCSWSKRKVALNYVETGAGQGRVVSVELQ